MKSKSSSLGDVNEARREGGEGKNSYINEEESREGLLERGKRLKASILRTKRRLNF